MAQSDLTRVVEPACRRLAQEQQVELAGTLDLTYGEREAHVLPNRWTPSDASAAPQAAPQPTQGEPEDENA